MKNYMISHGNICFSITVSKKISYIRFNYILSQFNIIYFS